MSWQYTDQMDHFYRACLFDDFTEFIRDHTMSTEEYNDLWNNFNRWQTLGSPGICHVIMRYHATPINNISIRSVYDIVKIRFILPLYLSKPTTMSKYYVPVEKDGKWELQEWQHGWTPTYNDPDNSGCHPMQEPTGNSYPTLESDSAYWASKAGVKMTSDEFQLVYDWDKNNTPMFAIPIAADFGEIAPIQSPTTKELIEQEAERQVKGQLGDGAYNAGFKDGFMSGGNFALSLPKQDNGDAWDEVAKRLPPIDKDYEMECLSIDVIFTDGEDFLQGYYDYSKSMWIDSYGNEYSALRYSHWIKPPNT